jgi:hypothetical protein
VCARKCRAKHPRATLGVRDVAFAIHTSGRRPKNSRFFLTGELNPASRIHFLAENLGLEGIKASPPLGRSLGRRKLGNAERR